MYNAGVAESNRKRAKHGMATSKIYKVWSSMHDRCRNPNNPRYARYGGRGIAVCKRWSDFANFYADMGDPPPGTQLERKNNNLGYRPSNCVWASRTIQQNNRHNNVHITFAGKTQTVSDWAREAGLSKSRISLRLKRGVKPPKLFDPKKRTTKEPKLYSCGDEMLPLLEISKRTGVKLQTLYYRVWNNKPLF